jgi:hypothetical protein
MFTFDRSNLRIDGVQSIEISPIQPDTSSTQYVRLIQLYTDPSTVENRRPVLEIAVYGGDQTVNDQTQLEILIPTGIEF